MSPEQLTYYREQYERVWPLLESAMLTYGPTHSKADIWALIEQEKSILWPMNRSAALTKIELYPTGFKELHVWLVGGDLEELKFWQPAIEAYGKMHGCKRAAYSGRDGWLRVFNNCRKAGSIMIKEFD